VSRAVTVRLKPNEVAHRIALLRETLTTLQLERLAVTYKALGSDDRFLLRTVLNAGQFPGDDGRKQEAFQDFRRRVNGAAGKAGIDFRLVLDSRKTSPDHRYGWFAGTILQRRNDDRELQRAIVRNELRISQILMHLGLPDIPESYVDEVLQREWER
jgi:hypothetical protein